MACSAGLLAIPMTSIMIERYEFGPFVLDVRRRVLQRSGKTIALAPKALDLLMALIERPGRVLSKGEILQRVWPDTFVEESNIAQNVSLLRKALGDRATPRRFIVTVPRSGYQLAATVRAIPLEERSDQLAGLRRPHLRSLAIFPFVCVSGEDLGSMIPMLFADGVATSLRQLPSLLVYVFPPLAQGQPPAEGNQADQARACGVDAFLAGDYASHGSWWRVGIHLFRTNDGALLWSTSVHGEFTTVSDAREAVSSEVFMALAHLFDRAGSSHPSTAEATNREVFRHYIRGRHFWNKRTAHGLTAAFDCAVRAIETDPADARGHLAMADTYALLGAQHALLLPRDAFPRARAAALRALELDNTCGQAYASLAFMNCWYDWDYGAAEANFRRAIELTPFYATAYHWWGEALASAGRFEESFKHFATATALDPLSGAIRTDFACALSLAGEYEKCEAMLAEVLKLDPDFRRTLIALAMNRERMGDFAGAETYVLRALSRQPHSPMLLALKARVCASASQRNEAMSALRQLESLSPARNVVRAELASVYASLHAFDRAQELIADAFARREGHVAWMINDPRFEALREETDLTHYWAARNVEPPADVSRMELFRCTLPQHSSNAVS